MDAGPDVDLPGIGPTPKNYVIAAGALIAGIVGYAYWRHRQAANATAAAPVDPSLLAPGATSFTNPDPNAVGSGSVNTTGAPATDAAWTQKAIADMANLSFDEQAVATVIGKYLAGQPLTSDEAVMIRTIWGMDGRPPEHPNLTIVTGAPAPGGSGGGGTSKPGAVAGLRAVQWGTHDAVFSWSPTTGATSYVIKNGVSGTREVTGTEAAVGGALGGDINFPYTFTVAAKNSAGTGPTASVTIQHPGGTH